MGVGRMTYRRIQWLAVGIPSVALGLFEFVRHRLLDRYLPSPLGNVAAASIVALGAYGFVHFLISLVEQTAAQLNQARAEAAVLSERQRIAREMHDGVAQAIFYLGVKLDRLDQLLAEGEVGAARSELVAVRENLQQTNRQVRAVISNLRQAADLASFAAAVRTAAARFEAAGLPVAVSVQGDPALPARVQEQLLAIIQEALTNTLKHGHAGGARIQVDAAGRGLRLVVEDDGCGFDPAAPRAGGHGLTIMAERARLAGGELRVETEPGRGTRVEVTLPEVSA